MGDRTDVQLIIHHCPPQRARVFLDLIEETGLKPQTDSPPAGALALGATYLATEVYCGWSDETAEHLVQAAPEAAWTVWEDPAYEWLGKVNRYDPELGRWGAECDSDGQGVFAAREIRDALAKGETGLAELLGEPWDAALDALDAASPDTVTEPDRFDVEWDTHTGEGAIIGADPDGTPWAFTCPADWSTESVTEHLATLGYHVIIGDGDGWSSLDHRRRLLTAEVYRLGATDA